MSFFVSRESCRYLPLITFMLKKDINSFSSEEIEVTRTTTLFLEKLYQKSLYSIVYIALAACHYLA